MIKKKQIYLLPAVFLVAFAFGLFILRNGNFTLEGDDEVYRTSIETWGSWGKWAHAYYYGNSGRVLIHAILIVLTNLPVIIWRVVSAAMIGVTCTMLYSYASDQADTRKWYHLPVLTLLSILLYIRIPNGVLGGSVRWAAGSVNYLYPVAAMLVCLFPFWKVLMGEKVGWLLKVAALLCVCLCGNMEQSSAVVSAMGVLCFAYYYWGKGKVFWKRHRNDIVFLLVIWAINTVIAVIGYLAPGNSSRYTEELIRFAGYDMYTFAEKIILGFQLFFLYFYSFRGLMIWLLPSCIIILVSILKKRYINIIPPMVNIFLSCAQNLLIRKVFNLEFVHPFNFGYAIWLFFSIGLLFYNLHIILKCSRNMDERFWLAFMYYGLLAAGVVVSLSPTLYVSAGRTMYICYILLLMIIVMMVRCVMMPHTAEVPDDRLWVKVNAILGSLASVALVLMFVFGTYTVQELDITKANLSTELNVQNVVVDRENGTLDAAVNVQPFAYTADNWCSGQLEGYVINIHVGVLDHETGAVKVFRTYIHPQYPVMDKYPEDQLALTGYLRKHSNLSETQEIVIVYTDPVGETWYTPVEA